MNVKEAAMRAGISVRTLRYYEEVGLIQPARKEENGYREYDEPILEQARLIRAYRELQFSLEEIKRLMTAPRMERDQILAEQIARLEKKRQIIDNRIALAQSLRMIGPEHFTQIDFSQVDAQLEQSRRFLEENEDMRQLSNRMKAISEETGERITHELLQYLANVANAPENEIPSAIQNLKQYIESNFYPCTDQILTAYARAYGGDGILAQALEDQAGTDAPQRLRQRLEPKNIPT